MSKYLDSSGLGYFWSKVKIQLNGKMTKPINGVAGQVLVGDGSGNWGPGSIAQTGTTTVSVSGTTLVIRTN